MRRLMDQHGHPNVTAMSMGLSAAPPGAMDRQTIAQLLAGLCTAIASIPE
jgi:hypothetical protein